jgi:lysophospholipase L1-like esterase
MSQRARNWVFLGDSLTEGVGSKRVSHVTELVKELRLSRCAGDANVHEFRLRHVGANFNRYIDFNVAGFLSAEEREHSSDIWLWNLACEGQTIESDFGWVPLIAALRPELVVIFRGSLEGIIRPAMLTDGNWPWWVPRSWRGYASMDPRCYFSNTWWRKAKQSSIDTLKQKARLTLLKARPGNPLIDLDRFSKHQTDLLRHLHGLSTRVLVLGLLPVDEDRFPGSPAYIKSVNMRLEQIAAAEGVEFFDWALLLPAKGRHADLFYRDSFHPNAAGARALAQILRDRVCNES